MLSSSHGESQEFDSSDKALAWSSWLFFLFLLLLFFFLYNFFFAMKIVHFSTCVVFFSVQSTIFFTILSRKSVSLC